MFARPTPTRMKGSTTQAFKSWVSKIHPQLPLTRIESQRLLTALTNSFRRHLDEAHPIRAEANTPEPRRPAKQALQSINSQSLHSSAVYADRHLASVLTSPLLAKEPVENPGSGYLAGTKSKLEKTPGSDPIELLENHHRQGIANFAIAQFCLRFHFEQLRNLSPHAQQHLINERKAGQRVLHWFWQTKSHHTHLDEKYFLRRLVALLHREGAERWIWEWVQTDNAILHDDTLTEADRHRVASQWRDCQRNLVSSLACACLDDPAQRAGRSANKALGVYAKASELLQNSARKGNKTRSTFLEARDTILRGLQLTLVFHLTVFPDLYAGTAPTLYNDFMNSFRADDPHVVYVKLFHPTEPDTKPLMHDAATYWARDAPRQIDRRNRRYDKRSEFRLYYRIMYALHLLEQEGDTIAYNSLHETLQYKLPELAPRVESDLERLRLGLTLATPEARQATGVALHYDLCPPSSV